MFSNEANTQEKMKCLDNLIGGGKASKSIKQGFLSMIIVRNQN